MEPAKFRLKKVDATDTQVWAHIVSMDAACFTDGSPALSDNEGAWWIARDAGTQEAAGYCGIKRLASGKWYLCRAGVLHKFRGKGLQKALIRRRLAYARSKTQEFSIVVTDTNDNIASANSLIACGFRLYAPEFKWSFDEALYWKKAITK